MEAPFIGHPCFTVHFPKYNCFRTTSLSTGDTKEWWFDDAIPVVPNDNIGKHTQHTQHTQRPNSKKKCISFMTGSGVPRTTTEIQKEAHDILSETLNTGKPRFHKIYTHRRPEYALRDFMRTMGGACRCFACEHCTQWIKAKHPNRLDRRIACPAATSAIKAAFRMLTR